MPLKCTRDGPVASICYPDAWEAQFIAVSFLVPLKKVGSVGTI